MTYPPIPASRAAASYQQTAVQSCTPLELVVMLYDGALRFVAHAGDGIARSDIAARQHGISRALAVVSELQSTLDMQNGGAIAAELDRLYAYVAERLTAASVTQDRAPLDDAARVLSTLREAWVAISSGSGVPRDRGAPRNSHGACQCDPSAQSPCSQQERI